MNWRFTTQDVRIELKSNYHQFNTDALLALSYLFSSCQAVDRAYSIVA